MITALTAYNVAIPRAFADRKAAFEWAATVGPYFPGSRIVQQTKRGLRTIWREAQQQDRKDAA